LYGLTFSSKFDTYLQTYIKDKLFNIYKEDKLSFDGEEGYSISSVRAMRLLAT